MRRFPPQTYGTLNSDRWHDPTSEITRRVLLPPCTVIVKTARELLRSSGSHRLKESESFHNSTLPFARLR